MAQIHYIVKARMGCSVEAPGRPLWSPHRGRVILVKTLSNVVAEGNYDQTKMPIDHPFPPPRSLLDDLRQIAVSVNAALQRFSKRLSEWVDEHQEGIAAALVGMQVLATVQPELERLYKKWAGTPWSHLLDEIDFVTAFALMLLLDRRQEQVVEDVLEPALTDPEFLAQLLEALADAPLPLEIRSQLEEGLGFIRARNYPPAVPLLIVPLEGAFWTMAEERQLVERVNDGMFFTAEGGKEGHKVGSVEAIFGPLGIDSDFHSFLVRLVYGSSGNPYRHGSAQERWRRMGLLLVVALVGWLDLYAETAERSLLARAFSRHPDALERAVELLPPLEPLVEHARQAVEPTINLLMGIQARRLPAENHAAER